MTPYARLPWRLAALILLAAPVLAADGDLIGPTFVLVELGGVPAIGEPSMTLVFSRDGSAGGSGGCNSYGGMVTIAGDSFDVANVISTLVACDEPVMTREQGFFAALETATRYHLNQGTLFLLDDVGNKLATLAAQ